MIVVEAGMRDIVGDTEAGKRTSGDVEEADSLGLEGEGLFIDWAEVLRGMPEVRLMVLDKSADFLGVLSATELVCLLLLLEGIGSSVSKVDSAAVATFDSTGGVAMGSGDICVGREAGVSERG